jgi:hypothetical protein
LLRVVVCGIGVCGIEVCGIERREGGGIGVRRSECVVYTDFRSRNRIWSVRDGKRLGCRDLRGALLSFAVSLRGLDEFGVGADCDVGILQGGEGEAVVAKFSLKESFHISLLGQGSTGETKKQLYGGMGACENGWSFVQARYSFST